MAGPFGMHTRNFGWGKHFGYACRRALEARYGGGHFSTIATHTCRIEAAVEFWRERSIRDARRIDLPEFCAYARHVAELLASGEINGVSYAQNLISSANVCLEALRGDRRIRVSPVEYVGKRRRSRIRMPSGLDAAQVRTCAEALRARDLVRAASVLELARHGGLRLREASLANLPRLDREARALGKCNIQDGCKGGRDAPRWITVTDELPTVLQAALATRPLGSTCLVAPGERVIDFYRREIQAARRVIKAHGITCLHDLRAAYACDLYVAITGRPVPLASPEPVDRDMDRQARLALSEALGHGREDVSSAYIGARRR